MFANVTKTLYGTAQQQQQQPQQQQQQQQPQQQPQQQQQQQQQKPPATAQEILRRASLARGNAAADAILLDLGRSPASSSSAGNGAAGGVGQHQPPPSSSTQHHAAASSLYSTSKSFRGVPSFASSAVAAAAAAAAAGAVAAADFTPTFNDVATSDVRVEVVDMRGELYRLLHLHSSVLREQSDYFFNTLVKRALRESGSPADQPPATFTIQTSRHVPDPEMYVAAFQLFYQEEDLISEDVVCMGSVWKVLQLLVVSAELQFHACTSACVDYLESVPWNDDELADILRLVPQLDRVHDARPVLDRLPVRTWDEESISDALRMLLIRAVAFHDTPPTLPSAGGGGGCLQGEVEDNGGRSSGREGGTGSGDEEDCAVVSGGVGRGFSGSDLLPSGTLECRDAACAILRSQHDPALPLKAKKVLLRETFVDLLQSLWQEQKRKQRQAGGGEGGLAQGNAREGGAAEAQDGGEPSSSVDRDNPGTVAAAGGAFATADGGSLSGERQVNGSGTDASASTAALHATPSSLGSPSAYLAEAVYGRQGALTWLTGVMVEFAMADEVFKWLATDREFIDHIMCSPSAASEGSSLVGSEVRGQGKGSDGEARRARESSDASSRSGSGSGSSVRQLYIVRSALVDICRAVLAKRLVANPQLRSSFVHTWMPVLVRICTFDSSPSTPLINGMPLSDDERDTVVSGFNELVLTLPCHEQQGVYQAWFRILSSSGFTTRTVSPEEGGPTVLTIVSGATSALASVRSASVGALSTNGLAKTPNDGAPGTPSFGAKGLGEGVPISTPKGSWFTLSPSYLRWLTRLGLPWSPESEL